MARDDGSRGWTGGGRRRRMTWQAGTRRTAGLAALVATLLLCVSALAMIQPARAAVTITVDRTDDPAVTTAGTGAATCSAAVTDCSLRGAVLVANADPGSTINIPAGTYHLTIDGSSEAGNCTDATIGDLDIAGNNTTISGAGSATTIIQQTAPNDRVICVDQFLAGNFNFSMSGVTITGGRETFGVGGGGMISGSQGDSTTLTNVVFSNNQASGGGSPVGGGLAHSGGSLSLTNVTFGGSLAPCASQTNVNCANSSVGSGGGLYLSANYTGCVHPCAGTFSITNSTFENNVSTAGNGGGLITTSGTAYSITGSTFTGNKAEGVNGTGGAVYNESGSLTVTKSTFLNNQVTAASGRGGAIGSPDGGGADVTVQYSRFVGNTAATATNGNTVYGGTGSTMTATEDWWGQNGPATNAAAGTVTTSPYIVLKTTASPTTVNAAGGPSPTSSTVTTSFLQDSSGGTLTTSQIAVLIGLPVTWSNSNATVGSLANEQNSIQSNGQATATFNAAAAVGSTNVGAQVDNGTATATIDVVAPDMTVTKSHSGNFRQGDAADTYTITVTNSGGAPTYATVSLADTLPTGLTATAMSGSGWSCTLGTLTCTRSDALANGSSYPAITLTVSVADNSPTSVTNTATVSGGGEINTSNDTANDPTTIIQAADLTIAKSHSGNFRQGDSGDTYAITVSNAPNLGPTVGTVTVVDTLPTGLTATALSGTGWSCDVPTLTCTTSTVLASGSSYPAITLTVNVANDAPASVTNSATVSGGGELNTSNDTGNDPTNITQVADLTVAKTHTGNFTQGDTGDTYTITVTNSGPGPTVGTVTVVDTLPTGLTATALSGSGWSCDVPTLTCTRSDLLASGSSYPAITLTVNVAPNAPASVTNSVTVAGGGELNTSNDSATDPTTVNQVADLTITKTHTGNFTQGDSGDTYTITVTNSGFAPTTGTVSVTDTLPSGLTATAISGSGWSCTLGTLTCTRSDALANGSSYPAITLTVNVADNAPTSVTNTATVSGGGEVVTSNDTASDPTTVNLVADLTIAKSHTGNFTQGDTGDTYTITVGNAANAGPTVGTVTVVDTLPSGLTATSISGTGWTCTLGTLTCTRSDSLASGSSYPAITLTVNVAATAPPSVTNTATVSGGGELSTANDTANDATTINQLPDLTIAKSHTGNFRQGDSGDTYTITVSNVGTGLTSGTVTVVDTLPTGLTATAMSGSGWSCTLGTLTCTRSDALAAGNAYPDITLTVNVAQDATPSLTNTATVSGGGDVNTSNNTANDPTTVVQAADLTIAKSHTGNFRQGDTGDTYTITVSNAANTGPTVGTVTVVDTLPTGLTATALSGSGWSCDVPTLTCTRSDLLASGSSYPAITLTINVAQDAAPSLTNSATVSGGGEFVTGNDTANDQTTIVQAADLTITKTHTGNFTQDDVGDTYTITVSNAPNLGPTVGTVTVVDTLPSGLTATAMSGTSWTCDVPTLTCTTNTVLPSGSSYPPITLTVNVAATAPPSLTNSATVSGGGEFVTGNDSASDPTTVIQRPDLTIAKSHTGNFTQGDSADTYTIAVSNVGTGLTSGTVTVVDTLPAGLTATAMSGSGWSCTLGTLTCTRSDALAAGNAYPDITLTVSVAGNAAASLTNTATVSGGGDVNPNNNTANDPTTVDAPPAITSANSTTFTVGTAGSFTVTTTGVPTPTVSETGALPSGVTFVDNGNGTATLSGTPTVGTGGTYSLTITAHNGIGSDATQTFTLTVDEAAAVTSADHTTFTIGVAGTFTVTTRGFPTPSLSETGALPTGVTFTDNGNGTATLSGTPAMGTTGNYPLVITAHNGVGSDGTQNFTLTVTSATTTTTAQSATAQDVDTSVTLSATVTSPAGTVNEGTVTFTVTDATNAPVGTAVSGSVTNGSASASYNPHGLAPGSYTITAAYSDAGGSFLASSGTATLTITPGPPATLTLAPGNTSAVVGTTVTETATVKDALGYPVADGTTVNFSVSGITTTSGSATTTNGQASFSYGAILPGVDTLTATAVGGSNPSATATITWTVPASTHYASLGVANFTTPYIYGGVTTGADGPSGTLTWRSSAVSFFTLRFTALVASGPNATLFGTATLSTGQTVTFRLDAVAGVGGTVRLRLSNGYDSGVLHVLSVTVSP